MPAEGNSAKTKSYSGHCEECNKTFNDIYAHKRASHQPTCQVTFKNGTVVTLTRDPNTGKFKCPGRHCHYMGSDPSNLNRHTKSSCKTNTTPAAVKGKKSPPKAKSNANAKASTSKKEPPRLRATRNNHQVEADSSTSSPPPQIISVLPPEETSNMCLKPQFARKALRGEDKRRDYESSFVATAIYPMERVTRSGTKRSKYDAGNEDSESHHLTKARYNDSGDETEVETLLFRNGGGSSAQRSRVA